MADIDINRRSVILNYLKINGETGTKEIAEYFGLTPMAIRLHMAVLIADGMVVSRVESMGRGRPEKLWSLGENAQSNFRDNHKELSLSLLDAIKTTLGTGALREIIDYLGRTKYMQYSDALSNFQNVEERLSNLAQIRTTEGYMAEVKLQNDGFLFIENHLPIYAAAKEYPAIYNKDIEIFEDLFGDYTVTRLENILENNQRTVYQIIPS